MTLHTKQTGWHENDFTTHGYRVELLQGRIPSWMAIFVAHPAGQVDQGSAAGTAASHSSSSPCICLRAGSLNGSPADQPSPNTTSPILCNVCGMQPCKGGRTSDGVEVVDGDLKRERCQIGPKRHKLVHASLSEYMYGYKRLKLAQLLGQLGMMASFSPLSRASEPAVLCR